MNNQNHPELITIEDAIFGSHVEHWNLLTANPTTDVPKWLSHALDSPVMPMGLCRQEQEMDQNFWLIQGSKNAPIQFAQVIAVENNKPQKVKTAFPCFDSPYQIEMQIQRIIRSESNVQAVLELNYHGNSIYAFDTLYSVNHDHYEKNQTYLAQLNAWAYELEAVCVDDQLVVDDPKSIQHHRALNDILAKNQGIAPENLQEQIDQWQAQSEDDKAPVTVNFSKMVAYLYGERLGQEDEAWFQGKLVGKTHFSFMDQTYSVYDVTLLDAENEHAAVVISIVTANPNLNGFEIGQYIRGNIWLQVAIHRKK